MPHKPEDMSDLMIELSIALGELARNMSNLAVAIENDYLQRATPLTVATRLYATEAIEKAKAR